LRTPALDVLYAFEESADWTQHSSFCDDSNLHTGPQPAKSFGGTEVTFDNDYDVIDVKSTTIYDLFAMISSAASCFLQKSLDSQKKFTRSEKNHFFSATKVQKHNYILINY